MNRAVVKLRRLIKRWWARSPQRIRRIVLTVVGALLLILTVRLLPYLAPIRAAEIQQTQQAIEFRDRHNHPLGTLLTRDQEHTVAVPLAQVSPNFIQAILAAEDSQFYHHGPLDLRAIARAIHQNLRAGRVMSGASTITMQLARMLYPLPTNLWGKLQEVWVAWRLGAGMSKDEILQAYVNRLPMGGNIYGVEAAARVYFDVPASELTVAQASLLAALPNDPTYLNPYEHWELLRDRQRYVLDRMVEDRYLTVDQSNRVFDQTVTLQSRQQGIFAAAHFLFWLSDRLPPLPSTQQPTQIQTTIDLPLQQFVETQVMQVARALAPHNAHHAAALVVDNHTGDVLAYVGSPDYFATAQQGRNDGVQALRQPGSTLKPLLYELALERGIIRPSSILDDSPAHYAIPGAKLYSPVDYDEKFQGPVRVRIALANSLNIPAVKLLERVTVPVFLNRLRQLGFSHLTQPADHYGLGLTLGSGEVSLWELAQAYLTLARHGHPIPLNPTLSPTLPPPHSPTLPNSPSWFLVTDMLSDRHARASSFGVDSVLNLPFPAAVKTGTSSDFRDTWTVGYTRDYTVATWVGNFNGDRMRKVSGVTGAAPLWSRIMLHLHEQQEPAAFPPPPGLVQRPICATTGLIPQPDCPSVVQEYFYPEDLLAYEQGQAVGGVNVAGAEGDRPLTTTAIQIQFPRNNDAFVIDPANPNQRLQFQLSRTPATAVEWVLNGQTLQTGSTATLSWPVRPGEWTLKVQAVEGTDTVRFTVDQTGLPQPRQGFSVVGKE